MVRAVRIASRLEAYPAERLMIAGEELSRVYLDSRLRGPDLHHGLLALNAHRRAMLYAECVVIRSVPPLPDSVRSTEIKIRTIYRSDGCGDERLIDSHVMISRNGQDMIRYRSAAIEVEVRMVRYRYRASGIARDRIVDAQETAACKEIGDGAFMGTWKAAESGGGGKGERHGVLPESQDLPDLLPEAGRA